MINSVSNSVSNAQFGPTVSINNTDQPTEVKEEKVDNSNTLADLQVDQEQLPADKAKKTVDSINNLLETTSTKLRYQYHEKLHEYYVTLVNSETNQVVREIPNKKLMDIYASMLEFAGIIVDKKI